MGAGAVKQHLWCIYSFLANSTCWAHRRACHSLTNTLYHPMGGENDHRNIVMTKLNNMALAVRLATSCAKWPGLLGL